MNRLLFIILLTFNTAILFSQDYCKEFKNGKFFIVTEKNDSLYTISRQDSIQIETSPIGLVIQFKVKWINNCNYVISVEKILKNPTNINFPLNAVFNVKLIGKTDQGYIQETRANFSERVMKSEIRKFKN
jgi:hypothetical protein